MKRNTPHWRSFRLLKPICSSRKASKFQKDSLTRQQMKRRKRNDKAAETQNAGDIAQSSCHTPRGQNQYLHGFIQILDEIVRPKAPQTQLADAIIEDEMANKKNPGCGCTGIVLLILFLMVASGTLHPLLALFIFVCLYSLLS